MSDQIRRETGLGLVEIMVGLAIGMITTLVIVQVASMFEGQKRSTTGVADAQTDGAVAIYSMQRQLQMAGYGLPIYSHRNQALHCADRTLFHPRPPPDGSTPSTPEDPVARSISPVEIISGTGAASDTIVVRRGSTGFGGVPLRYPSAAGQNNMICRQGDRALITDGTTCVVTTVSVTPTETVPIEFSPTVTSPAEGTFACLGDWREFSYRVQGNNLLESDVPIANGIVALRALYGVSEEANTNQVLSYVDPRAGPQWASATITAGDRNRIKAIRVVMVFRSGILETEAVTQPCASAENGLCVGAGTTADPQITIDLSSDENWRRYRYRVFDTVVPLRNMIWSAEKL